MRLTQRQVAFGLQLFVNFGFAIAIVIDALGGYSPILTQIRIVCLIATIAVMIAYWRGWRYASAAVVLLAVIVVALASIDGHYDPTNVIAFLIPPLFAVVLGRFFWVIGAAAATPILTILLSRSSEWNDRPVFFVLYIMVTIGIALSRQIFDLTAQQAQDAARQAESAQQQAEFQAESQAAANIVQQEQLEEQHRLLALVSTLETPTITLADGVLFAPIVGQLDSGRLAALTGRLLDSAYAKRARHVILDISGVLMLDTSIAQTLLHTAQALQLLGCRVILSGISAEMALMLSQHRLELNGVMIVRSPQEALAQMADRL